MVFDFRLAATPVQAVEFANASGRGGSHDFCKPRFQPAKPRSKALRLPLTALTRHVDFDGRQAKHNTLRFRDIVIILIASLLSIRLR